MGLEKFEEKYYYRILEPDVENKIREIDLITEIGKEDDDRSVSYIRISLRVYFQTLDGNDLGEISEDNLKILFNIYIFPRLKTMVSSITDQSRKLMPYFIKPIFELEKID